MSSSTYFLLFHNNRRRFLTSTIASSSTWWLWSALSSSSSSVSFRFEHAHHSLYYDCIKQNHRNFCWNGMVNHHHHHQKHQSSSTTTTTTSSSNCNIIHLNKLLQNHHKYYCQKRYLASSTEIETSGDGGGESGKLVAFNLSDIGEGIGEVTIKEWFVKVGDQVKQFDNICEVQSDKASVTITSRYDGIIKKIYYKVDDLAKVGEPLVDILVDGTSDEGSSTESQPNETSQLKEENVSESSSSSSSSTSQDYLGGGKILTTPAVRRLALEHKIQLDQVVGTGRDGRIMKEDMLNFINNKNTTAATKPSTTTVDSIDQQQVKRSSPPKPPLPPMMPLKEDRIESMTSIMKGMFKTMTKSLSIPHFGLSEEIDLTNLIELKPEMKKISKEKDIPLSFMPFFIKAASLSLNEYPILNSSIDEINEKIIYKSAHNIGVAMDTKNGLLVPNIKNVNQLTIMQIAQELQRLQQLAQKGQLGVKDLTGGTFTLSNIGSIGGTFGIPVLMPSEVAIGAIGRIRQVPRFVDDDSDQLKRAYIIQVLWSADHRIIDGATMTRFCNRWKQFLENPLRIFIY